MKRKTLVCAAFAAAVLAAGIGAVWLRVNPRWQDASLTIETQEMPGARPCIDPAGDTLETRILPPEGYTRTPAAPDSLCAYLRAYPLLPDGTAIPVYDGSPLSANGAAAVFDISLNTAGYQQCADSIIRLYSDYFRATGQEERLAYHFSNGFLCEYADWKQGWRVLAAGNFACRLPFGLPGDDDQTYRSYLLMVMRYAGTISLEQESVPIAAQDARTGDILCHAGAPGHVVLLADEAVNAAGERAFLLGQGYIPSQCFHIIHGMQDGDAPGTSPWYTAEQLAAEPIRLTSYTFHTGELRRWNGGF